MQKLQVRCMHTFTRGQLEVLIKMLGIDVLLDKEQKRSHRKTLSIQMFIDWACLPDTSAVVFFISTAWRRPFSQYLSFVSVLHHALNPSPWNTMAKLLLASIRPRFYPASLRCQNIKLNWNNVLMAPWFDGCSRQDSNSEHSIFFY